ncbi:MAG TPA: DUF72 domain-containing protein [Polyangiaceae bacterium]|nr:DUF72 domain-containing protein [Polyangiaceae bacterium]
MRIGISGWNYPGWRGVFFPRGLPQKSELAFASRQVDSIEINGSFYSLLRPESVVRWHDQSPEDFTFAVKGSRYITHMKRLRGVEVALANFFASGVLALREKLGPVLWQLPPSMAFDAARLAEFFELLPRTTMEAAALARKHDARTEGRSYLEAPSPSPLRYSLEIRHPTFRDEGFIALLRRYGIALCVSDTAGLYPDFDDVTADFVYVRLHGDTELYASGYDRRALSGWARRIGAWRAGGELKRRGRVCPASPAPASRGRDVYVYFDNDAKVRAPFDARALQAIVRGKKAPR